MIIKILLMMMRMLTDLERDDNDDEQSANINHILSTLPFDVTRIMPFDIDIDIFNVTLSKLA